MCVSICTIKESHEQKRNMDTGNQTGRGFLVLLLWFQANTRSGRQTIVHSEVFSILKSLSNENEKNEMKKRNTDKEAFSRRFVSNVWKLLQN